jgi:fluoride ion exporter CrcB/FEX
VTLQLTPEGYVKVLRTGVAGTYYIATTFSSFSYTITTNTAQAEIFRFTTSV